MRAIAERIEYTPTAIYHHFRNKEALLSTADYDLVKSDPHNYRVAFVEAFRRRGIYSASMADPTNDAPRTLSVDTLRWRGLDTAPMRKNKSLWNKYEQMMQRLKHYANDCLYLRDRSELFSKTREVREALQVELKDAFAAEPGLMEALGLDRERKTFEVHELRRATRVSPDGELIPQVIVSLLQTQAVPADATSGTPAHTFRGGSTLLVDLVAADVEYCVMKRVRSSGRRERTAAFLRDAASDKLSALMLLPDEHEPFALLHSLGGGAGGV